jgi:hypothetical protein
MRESAVICFLLYRITPSLGLERRAGHIATMLLHSLRGHYQTPLKDNTVSWKS